MSKFIGNSITLPNLATAPSSPTAGDVYYNTTENKPYSYNGTAWVLLVPSASGAMNYAQTQATKQTSISADGVTIVSTSITTSGYPVQVMVTGDAENSAVGAWVKLQLYRDSTAIGKIIHVEGSAGSENIPYALTVIDAPSAGTYTYALKTASAVAGGTYNFGETDGPVLTAIELSGATGAGGGSGDITDVVAGAGLTGGATSGSATLTVGAGTGITVNADDVAINTATVPLKSDNLGVFAVSTSAVIGVGTIELGHATDTTLSRSAAGTLAVEGVAVALTSQIPPTGSVVMWMTGTAPSGWLFLDGSTISQSTYPALAAVFGVGSGTFALPDMRDRFAAGRSDTALGWANSSGTFGPNAANSIAHTHTTDIAHGHADTIAVSTHADHTHNTDPAATTSGAPSATFNLAYSGGATNVSIPTTTHTHSTNIASTASGAETSNLTHTVTGGVTSLGATSVTSSAMSANGTIAPKSTLLNFIIKT